MTEKKFNFLVKEYGDSILRMCYIILKDYHLAEDCTQETFLAVMKGYDKFRGECTEKTWILSIAVNICRSVMRKRSYSEICCESFPEITEDNRYDGIIDRELFISEISKLPYKQKTCILLFYYQQLKVSEIAKVMKEKESTVKSHLKRGRDALRPVLKEAMQYEE